jgi:uncharacterized membrane protein (DUF4010 family)
MFEAELGGLLGRLGLATGIGLLVGLQREQADSRIAGLRTFALTALFGAICAVLADEMGGWVLAAGLIALAAMVVLGNVMKLKAGLHDPGITTEVAILLMFVIGAYLMVGRLEIGIVTGGGLAVLLQFKARAQRLVARLGNRDVAAVMRFALLTLVILPILPNRTFGPFDVLNPRNVWLMVVLIVGIGFAGYLAYRFLGTRAGTALSGLLGGAISSTATTVSYSRRGRERDSDAREAAVVIMIASAIVFVRVLIEVAAVAPLALGVAAPPILLTLAGFSLISFVAWWRIVHDAAEREPMPEQTNPTELGPALFFGGLYALILLGVASGEARFGSEGIYAIAAISGLADMDAITLSASELHRQGRLEADTLWRVVLVGALSNLVFKAGICGLLGGRLLLRHVLPLYAAGAAVILSVITLWP